MEDARVIAPAVATLDEIVVETSLRPRVLAEYIGQQQVKDNLAILLAAARQRGEAADHILLYGPPGLDKTTLANIVARELGVNIHTTSGPAIERPGDLAAILTNLDERDILFIDEIHRLSHSVEEILYPAMEDFAIDVMIGRGPSARSLRLSLKPFTVVGATTRAGRISSPLRDRFGAVHRLDYYSVDELEEIVRRSAGILDVAIEPEAVTTLARRGRGTPRVVNRLLRRVRDHADVLGDGRITGSQADAAMAAMDIDSEGLDTTDRRLLAAIIQKFASGPVGGAALAAVIGEEVDTIEDVYEPYLLQLGFLDRTPQGRIATERARDHLRALGYDVPQPRRADRMDPGLWDGMTVEGRTGSESPRVTDALHDRGAIGSPAPGSDSMAIVTRQLVKRYGPRVALTGLDLNVPRGAVYGFLGPNGSGKTTTLRLLVGLIRPNEGTIEMLGQPYSWRDRRRMLRIGSLIESPAFYPYLSGRDNLRVFAAAGPPTSRRGVDQALDAVGLSDRAGDKVKTYSLGMRQRLGIAVALLSDPELLLLDEPANGLDPAGIVAMRELLRQLTDQGKTVLVSSHILPEVQQLADVVGIIDRGRLVREGPLERLLGEGARVRVRVHPSEAQRAAQLLQAFGAPIELSPPDGPQAGWLTIRVPGERAAEVNRVLAQGGVYAGALDVTSDLETVFLSLTAVAPPPAAPAGPPPGWGMPPAGVSG